MTRITWSSLFSMLFLFFPATQAKPANTNTCGGQKQSHTPHCPAEVTSTEWTQNCLHSINSTWSSTLIPCDFADPLSDLFIPKASGLNWTVKDNMRTIPEVVNELLAPWTKNARRIGPANIWKPIPGKIPTASNQHQIWWFQVKNNTLYMDKTLRTRTSSKHARARIAAVSFFLMLTMQRYSLPDLDFVALQTDECWDLYQGWNSKSFFEQYPPTFSLISCLYSSHIGVPWGWPTENVPEKIGGHQPHKMEWSQRVDQVIFRGRPGGNCFPNWRLAPQKKSHVLCGRSRLEQLSDCGYDSHLNVSFLKGNEHKTHDCFMSMNGQASFKMILYMEGNFGWSLRLRSLLETGSVILKQMSYSDEWYGHFLQPWVHYVPVDYYLSNLKKQIEWVLSHPQEAARIGRNAQSLISHIKSGDFLLNYTAHLMTEYANNVLNQSANWPFRPAAKLVQKEFDFSELKKKHYSFHRPILPGSISP